MQWSNSYDLLFNACNSVKKAGAEAIVFCAHTPHMIADKLEREIGLPVIDLVSATADAVLKQNVNTVGLLGTSFTMEMDFFKEKLKNRGITSLIPDSQETRNFIQKTLKDELGKGIFSAETKQAYISIIHSVIEAGAQGIIFGCTEIPMLLSQQDVSVAVFDTTKIHAQAAVNFALSKI